MTDYQTVVDHLSTGNWEAAHEIVQSDESALAAWAHGIVHLIEGDRKNAGYWYRRADRELASDVSIDNEIEKLRTETRCS